MPIGTGKLGLFGGVGVSIEAGSETFNAPGTFTVPADLKIASISGNGATGNAGNPGNPGGDGIGGYGGQGGFIPPFYVPGTAGAIRGCPINALPNQNKILGAQRHNGGTALGPPASPFCPFVNPPGGPGNPGNPGGVTSALGYCWTSGSGGAGGTGGVDGSYGNPGSSGTSATSAASNPYSQLGDSSVQFFGSYTAGGTGAASGGGGGKAAIYAKTCYVNCPSTTIWSNGASGLGGAGGGGAGTANAGNDYPSCYFGVFYMNSGNKIYASSAQGYSDTSGNPGGGAGGYGGATGNPAGGPCENPYPSELRASSTGGVASVARAGGGGGGGGAGMWRDFACQFVPPCSKPYVIDGVGYAGLGGGGGGSGSTGNPGSGAGNPGNAGTPAAFNCVPLSAGCYPVQVGAGGQVVISWNAQ